MTPPPRRRTVLGAALATLPALGLAACGEVTVEGRTEEAEQLRIIDDQDREVLLPGPARTAVVLNSYTNEFLRAIGAGDRVVGVDRLNYEAIAGLEPDVVILPRNAVWQEAAEQLESFGIPLVVATAWDTAVVDETLTLLGEVFGLEDGASAVLDLRAEIAGILED